MKLKLTQEEIKNVRDIIQRYRDVSNELYIYQNKAEEIQTKVIELEKNLGDIKSQEDGMMEELHKKYGKFTLQDVYEVLLVDGMMK